VVGDVQPEVLAVQAQQFLGAAVNVGGFFHYYSPLEQDAARPGTLFAVYIF
jgi:hypothetical protein